MVEILSRRGEEQRGVLKEAVLAMSEQRHCSMSSSVTEVSSIVKVVLHEIVILLLFLQHICSFVHSFVISYRINSK